MVCNFSIFSNLRKLIVILNYELKVILPDKFKDKITSNFIEKYQIENITILKLVYNGSSDLLNSFKTHIITLK